MRYKFSFAAFFLALGSSISLAQAPPAAAPQAIPVMPQVVEGGAFPGQIVSGPAVLGNCGTGCGDCGCGPSWLASAKFLYMKRNSPSPAPLINLDDSSSTVFNASQYNFDMAPGADISVSKKWGDIDLQVRYFGVFSAAADNNFSSVPATEIAGQPASVFLANTDFTTRYTTDVHSVEVNVGKWSTAGLRWQIGVRWLNLSEGLAANTVETNGVLSSHALNTDNNLYGGQIGVDGVLWDKGCWGRVVAWGKGGVYYAETDSSFQFSNNAGQTANGSVGSNSTAFVGELGLDWQIPVTRNFSLNIGTQLMYLSGVATASDQNIGIAPITAATANNVTMVPQSSGSLLLYGFNVGAAFTW